MSERDATAEPPSDKVVDERVPTWTLPEYKQICAWLEGAEKIWLPLHVSPDGDCLGSSLAFAKTLQARGYDCTVVSSDPIPAMYQPLFNAEDVFIGAVPPGPPATHIACLDISDPTRTGDFYQANEAAFKGGNGVRLLNMDHHATNVRFGDLQLLDTSAPACAEQVFIALKEIGWPIDTETANYLLLGIITDTLGFRTPSTTERTLRIAADLRERGGDMFKIVDLVFNSRPLSSIMLWSKALSSVATGADGRVLFVQVTPRMLEEADAKEEELEGMSSYLASVRGKVKVAAVLKEREDGTTRVSFRSKPGVDVAAIARHFGGGGHPQAAGATISAIGEEASRLFLQACSEVLDTDQAE
ncbi:MAG TPA: bifunctional oligoribonuclease/PAP phosphatase NrnA [Chloroflexia bacterium]|nr:bifunctional oligoribonuclease/PAP phosphatase NrnA [Chloroflexia bacterium]